MDDAGTYLLHRSVSYLENTRMTLVSVSGPLVSLSPAFMFRFIAITDKSDRWYSP